MMYSKLGNLSDIDHGEIILITHFIFVKLATTLEIL
jgi:hypothetical protein